jgi:hypothetical protein
VGKRQSVPIMFTLLNYPDVGRPVIVGYIPDVSEDDLRKRGYAQTSFKYFQLAMFQACLRVVLTYGGMMKHSPLIPAFTEGGGCALGRFILGNVSVDYQERMRIVSMLANSKPVKSKEVACYRCRVRGDELGAVLTTEQIRQCRYFQTPEFFNVWKRAISMTLEEGKQTVGLRTLSQFGLQSILPAVRDAFLFQVDRDVVEDVIHWVGVGEHLVFMLCKILRELYPVAEFATGKVEDKKVHIVDEEGDLYIVRFVEGNKVEKLRKSDVKSIRTKDAAQQEIFASIDSCFGILSKKYVRSYRRLDPFRLSFWKPGMRFRAVKLQTYILFLPHVLASVLPLELHEREWIIETFILFNKFLCNWCRGKNRCSPVSLNINDF